MPSNAVKKTCKKLGISRATYYRLKKNGRLFTRQAFKHGIEGHQKCVEGWLEWKDTGLYERVWAASYRSLLSYQLKKFLDKYLVVTSVGLENWLKEVPPIQHSKRKDRYQAVVSFAKYLVHIGKLTDEEYQKIRRLHPKAPPMYQPKQRIIYKEDLERLIAEAGKNYFH